LLGDWAGYTAWLIIADNLSFLLLCRIVRGPTFWRTLQGMRLRVVTSGILGLLSFCVFLWALSRSPVGAVSALRETSVLFAMLIGVFLHRESLSFPRVLGGLVIFLGIVTISL
jgi:uncharacterized membrane protein